MTNNESTPPGVLFWSISGIALIWNLMGLIAYWGAVTLSSSDLAQMSEAERMIYQDPPMWVTSAFAIAVVTGMLGSLALLLRKRWATPLFVVSLIGVIVQRIHIFFMTNFVEVMDAERLLLPVLVFVIAVFLVWFAAASGRKGWLA